MQNLSMRKFYSFPRLVASEGARGTDPLEEVFELMKKGDERIELDPKHKNPIFVLGNTGSGKSTLILFVATDNTSLRSEETHPGSGDFRIVDDNHKIGSGINSQTDVPELVVDKATQASYYDCPGFNDTRTAVNEIATSYFIKKIFDFADEMKILLTVNFASVRIGLDRTDFMNLLRNATTLIKDIDKYQNSIGLVVTKVENLTGKLPDGGYGLIPDEKTIAAAASFMVQTKDEIKQRLEMVKGDVKEETFLHNALNLIDKFLVQDAAGKYPKIVLFRQPDEAGPLLDVELLQNRKPDLIKLIHKTMKYTKKDSADIGHTISDTAKLVIKKILEKLVNYVSVEIDTVVQTLRQNHEGVTGEIKKLLESYGTDSNEDTDVALGRSLLAKLGTSAAAITKLNSDVVKATQIGEIAKAVESCGTKVNLDFSTSVANLKQQNNYFEFLTTFTEGLSIGDYSKKFDGILTTLTVKIDTSNTVETLKIHLSTEIDKIVETLNEYYHGVADQIQKLLKTFAKDSNTEVDIVSAKNLSTQLITSHDKVSELKADVVNAKTIKEIAEATRLYGNELKLDTEASAKKLMQLDTYFEFLQAINGGLSIGNYGNNFNGILATLPVTIKEIEKDAGSTAEKVRERIKSNLTDVVTQLRKSFDAEIDSLGIEELVIELGKQRNVFTDFVEKIKAVNSAQKLSKEISNMVAGLEIDSVEINSLALAVLNNGKYLTVMSILKNGISVWSQDWIKPFDGPAQYMNVSVKWYGFLQKLYKKLSTYKYIGYQSKYNVANLDDWAYDGRPQGIKINKANYKNFLIKIDETDDTVKSINLDERKEQELNHVLDLTIKHKPKIFLNADKDTFTAEGVFVKFSDLVDQHGNLQPSLGHGKKLQIVNIYATDTVFINADLTLNETEVQVNVVAPRWEIVDTRIINLFGTATEAVDGQGSTGTFPAGRGADGKPGLPGSPGGNFVGVGNEFKAFGNLTINTRGGRGGKGQKGGEGGRGENGADGSYDSKFGEHLEEDHYDHNDHHELWRFDGQVGYKGGTGGDGGAGGLGGLPGNTKIIRINDSSYLPKINSAEGSDGEGGDGGSGGTGGKYGDWYYVDKIYYESNDGYVMAMGTGRTYTEYRSELGPFGDVGTKNANTSGRMGPKKPVDLNPGEALNAFETYLRDTLDDRFLKEALKKFLDQLHLSKSIYSNSIYDSKLLLENVSNLEDQLPKLNNKLTNDEIIYLYQSIMQRTIAYSKSLNLKPVKDKEEQKKSLNHIQTILLGKIQSRVDSFNN